MLDVGRNLTYQLTHQLGAAIIQGQYAPDKNFPTEAELSQRFNISRSVTREAVKMLTAKGLIASRPRQGIRVMPSTSWNMFDADILSWMLNARSSMELLREFTQLRQAIEPEAAILAAAHAHRPELMAPLDAALLRIRTANHEREDVLEAVIEFYGAMLAASNNRFFLQLRVFSKTALQVTHACSKQLTGSFEANNPDYQDIVIAIKAGNGQAAREAVLKLLMHAQELIIDQAQSTN